MLLFLMAGTKCTEYGKGCFFFGTLEGVLVHKASQHIKECFYFTVFHQMKIGMLNS